MRYTWFLPARRTWRACDVSPDLNAHVSRCTREGRNFNRVVPRASTGGCGFGLPVLHHTCQPGMRSAILVEPGRNGYRFGVRLSSGSSSQWRASLPFHPTACFESCDCFVTGVADVSQKPSVLARPDDVVAMRHEHFSLLSSLRRCLST